MKKLLTNDYVIYDRVNENPLRDSGGKILLFNQFDAHEVCKGNESIIPCTALPEYLQNELLRQIEEPLIADRKGRILKAGDLVVLVDARDLDNEDVQHDEGDVFQFIGGDDDNIGNFIHCKNKKETGFFADRTFKINQYERSETN
jgi:hypothetical protein